ncbi:hypothetical protein NC651_032988 [Populus alba x Populus x berolinensis]|nr:hypothetical protein NC651_032988 [Populus alba x Populus x berolinensis]
MAGLAPTSFRFLLRMGPLPNRLTLLHLLPTMCL